MIERMTDLHLEYGCSEAFALTFSVPLLERNTPLPDSRIDELILTTYPALVSPFVVLLVFCRAIGALDFGPAISAVFGLHLDLAHVWVGTVVPATLSECAAFSAAKATLTKLSLAHQQG